MSNAVSEDLGWLRDLLDQHEFEVTGTPKHWEKSDERKALDDKLIATIASKLRQVETEARKNEIGLASEYVAKSPFAYPMLEGGFFNAYCNNRLATLTQEKGKSV